MKRKIRRQKPIKGGRIPQGTSIEDGIKHAVDMEARKYNCSKSYVVATILAVYFGLDSGEKYYD